MLLSQKDLADWMDVSLRTVQNIENSNHLPSIRTRGKFNKVKMLMERLEKKHNGK